MKRIFSTVFTVGGILAFAACNNSGSNSENATDSTSVSSTSTMEMNSANGGSVGAGSYVDLNTGKSVTRDDASGRYVDDAGNPVDFYVDVNSRDTFYGESGQNVNNAIIHEGDAWRVDDTKVKMNGNEMKVKGEDDDTKVKMNDNEVKIKGSDDSKIKANENEYKEKSGNGKVKSNDNETKIK